MNSALLTANKNTYIGLFFTTLAVLMYEILLTRIFSVIAYYHFAFMAISIAMFGMTVGALIVYLLPQYRENENTHQQLAFSSLLFSVTIVQSFLILLVIPLQFHLTISGVLLATVIYLLISIPFVFSGICVCLALTKFNAQVNSLYAADLIGASIGCIAIILILDRVSGPTAVIIVAIAAGLGAIFFSRNVMSLDFKRTSVICTIILCLLAWINCESEKHHIPLLRLSWVKNTYEEIPIYEKWNAFSRLTVVGYPLQWQAPFGWGLSDTYPKNKMARYLWLFIDGRAGTPLLNYRNNLGELDYLKYDVSNFAHYLRPHADVLIIGVGGGRDILSAQVFQQKSVTGVEVNNDILKIITQKFADYTGHIDQLPHVKLINAEARSYIFSTRDQFDIIEMSLIDTWSATSAGAYALSENSLYTVQTWQAFLNHLTPRGLITVSRYYLKSQPTEIYRLTALASQALVSQGVAHPDQHLMIISAGPSTAEDLTTATVLVSRNPFSTMDVTNAKNIAKKLHFAVIQAPTFTQDPMLQQLASHQDVTPIFNKLGLDISPPTDDKPFFFQMLKVNGIFNPKLLQQNYYYNFNSYAVISIGVLLIIVTVLTLLCVLFPFIWTQQKQKLKNTSSFLAYFACIGFGFMLVEISQVERLTIFLGHPIYGLSVVLFALLLSTGLGSMIAPKLFNDYKFQIMPFLLLLISLSMFGYLSGNIINYFQTSETLTRISIAIALLFPLGFFMGIAMPFGIQLANRYSKDMTPWLWGINGATSICGSVMAIIIALAAGISASYWIGVLCYCLAFMLYIWIKFVVIPVPYTYVILRESGGSKVLKNI